MLWFAARQTGTVIGRDRGPMHNSATTRKLTALLIVLALAALEGKVVVLNFWASWCEPCQTEAPLLERAQARLRRAGGTVLGVTYLDATPDSLGFVRRFHLTYPNLRDNDGVFAHSYGTDQLPESFVIDRRGQITAISRGEIGQAFLDRAIALAQSS